MTPSPMDEKLYDQLVAYLAAKAKVREDFGAGLLILHEHEGRALEPPMRLHLTTESFADHLRATEADAAGDHPDLSPTEAAWRRFVERLGNAVESAGAGETEVVIDGTDVVARRPE